MGCIAKELLSFFAINQGRVTFAFEDIDDEGGLSMRDKSVLSFDDGVYLRRKKCKILSLHETEPDWFFIRRIEADSIGNSCLYVILAKSWDSYGHYVSENISFIL